MCADLTGQQKHQMIRAGTELTREDTRLHAGEPRAGRALSFFPQLSKVKEAQAQLGKLRLCLL